MHHPDLQIQSFLAMDLKSRWNQADGCFDIETPHALSQLAGYAKYKLSSEGVVYFRGQTEDYGCMRPALFRGVLTKSGWHSRIKELKEYIQSIDSRNAFVNGTPENVQEPLLQHYGLKTDWFDLVDNIWVALWFSCHQAVAVGLHNEYVNFEISDNEYSYIYLMQFGEQENYAKGCWVTKNRMAFVDLRVAAPSNYLRPHSQHGLLVRRRNIDEGKGADFDEFVVLVLRIRAEDAVHWIGQSLLMQDSFLFPSPKYDQGYKVLIEKELPPNNILGRVQFIGA
jgi:hypothetical protein